MRELSVPWSTVIIIIIQANYFFDKLFCWFFYVSLQLLPDLRMFQRD